MTAGAQEALDALCIAALQESARQGGERAGMHMSPRPLDHCGLAGRAGAASYRPEY
jgi:hypothetical protein